MNYIRIALGKGRLANTALECFQKIGICLENYDPKSRKLIFVDEEKKIRVVLVKASDVPIYVEHGAADIGIVGKDTLMETNADVYEIMDLGFGKCKFVVAAPKECHFYHDRKLRVATKYPNVAKEYYRQKGEPIEIIRLNGSVELAPLMGLSDVIVDIVETGTTLKENGLEVLEDMYQVSARLIVNKVSFKTRGQEIGEIVRNLQSIIEKKGDK